MNSTIRFLAAVSLATVISSCKKEEDAPPTGSSDIGYTGQMMIINEGAFGSSNGSIDFINPATGERTANVFSMANNQPIGDVVQSAVRFGNRMFIAVNNSQKVEVVQPASFKRIATITGFLSPRYCLPLNNSKMYVTDWGDNSVKIVSLSGYTITGSIPVNQNGPEQLIEAAGKVFVINSGGFSDDSTLTVIDPQTDQILTTLPTGVNPNSIVKDPNGKIWILCGGDIGADWTGGTADDTGGRLIRLNPENYTVELDLAFSQFEHPLKMIITGTQLYFLNGMSGYDGEPCLMGIQDNALPASSFVNKTFYGVGVNPDNGDVYGCYSPFFGQSGYVFRYRNTGVLIDSIKVGIGPNSAWMNR